MEPQYFPQRQQGGGSVTIWAASVYNGVLNIAVLNGSMNSEKDCQIQGDCFLLDLNSFPRTGFISKIMLPVIEANIIWNILLIAT